MSKYIEDLLEKITLCYVEIETLRIRIVEKDSELEKEKKNSLAPYKR
jgi:hypothetical protein